MHWASSFLIFLPASRGLRDDLVQSPYFTSEYTGSERLSKVLRATQHNGLRSRSPSPGRLPRRLWSLPPPRHRTVVTSRALGVNAHGRVLNGQRTRNLRPPFSRGQEGLLAPALGSFPALSWSLWEPLWTPSHCGGLAVCLLPRALGHPWKPQGTLLLWETEAETGSVREQRTGHSLQGLSL